MKTAIVTIAGLVVIAAKVVAGTVPGLFNTGVDAGGAVFPLGDADLHYSLTGPLSNAVVLKRHLSSSNFTWVAAPPGSAWIGPANSGKAAPMGDYTYTLQFELVGDTSMVELSGDFSSDNKARIFLNGQDTGNHNTGIQYRGLKSFKIADGLLAGMNTLEFRTTNSAGRGRNPTGLLVANVKLADKSVQLALASHSENQKSVSTQHAFIASPAAVALPRDNAFGHALPHDIGLTHLVETSPDLVHWSLATNLVFYFKDLDSANFNERYYRFGK